MDSIQKILTQTDRAFDPDQQPIGMSEIKELAKSTLRPALSSHPAEEAPLTPETEEPGSTLRFGSQQEAEGKVTEQEQAVTKLAADIEETKGLLLRTLAGAQHGQPAQPAPETPAPEEDFVKKRRREAMSDVEALDPDEEDYKDKVADAQARADKDIHHYSLKQFAADVEAEQSRADTELQVRGSINAAMREGDLDPASSADQALFSHYSDRFQVIGSQLIDTTTRLPVTTDDAINKTVNMAKNYKQTPIAGHQASGEPELENDNKPMSLRDIVGSVGENRRA